LQQLGQRYGLMVELQEETFQGQEQANVFIRQGPRQTEEFLLQSHFDTVHPGSPSLWTENLLNPFHAVVKEGKIFGLGACEGKLDLLCKLEALRSFTDRPQWKLAPVVVGTYGEELGMQGLLRAIRKEKFNATCALVGEPTGQQLVFAGKGYAILELIIPFSAAEREFRLEHNLKESATTQTRFFKGANAHFALGDSADNAIQKALDYLGQIPEGVVLMDLEGGIQPNRVASHAVLELDLCGGIPDPMVKKLGQVYRLLQTIAADFLTINDPDFTPANPSMNLGLIQALEDHVQLTVSFRLPPVIQERQYQDWLQRLRDGTTLVGGQCRVSDYKRPYRTDLNSPFVKTCQEALSSLGMPAECVTKTTCTEMSLLSRIGVVGLVFGAGRRQQTSGFNTEVVNIADLEKSIHFYRTIIERVCL
jgi:succinyl-diaminopimelate desuccinylase